MEKTMTIEERFENASLVGKFDMADLHINQQAERGDDFRIEVRREDDGNYIAWKFHDREDWYEDNFDYDAIFEYCHEAIYDWYYNQADIFIENAKYQNIDIIEYDKEALDKTLDRMTSDCEYYNEEYFLQFYYNDDDYNMLKEETLSVWCYDDSLADEFADCTITKEE
jgi:hypothetical protein